MVEFTIEQKAKVYDEALKRAKSVGDSEWSSPRDVAEYIFPELKEGGDDRVRNKLIEFFKGYYPDKEWWGNITQRDILAWFEKQDEQKSWSKEDEMQLDAAIHLVSNTGHIETANWLKDLKNRVLPQPKHEWSKENERIYRSITYSFAHNFPLTVQQQEFVKFLKERYAWKPSDEQFKLLKHIMENVPLSYIDKSEVGELYLDLKRL